MHATFSFLLPLCNVSNDDSALTEEAKNHFEHQYSEVLDENNWYVFQALVCDTGHLLALCDDSDYRGRHSLAEEIQTIPAQQRWQWTHRFSMQCVATDMELRNASPYALIHRSGNQWVQDADFDTLIDAVYDEVPQRLSTGFSMIKGKRPNPDTKTFDSDLYRLFGLARSFDLLNGSMEYNPPFSHEQATPYEYRAFDLTHLQPANAILLVDIHT